MSPVSFPRMKHYFKENVLFEERIPLVIHGPVEAVKYWSFSLYLPVVQYAVLAQKQMFQVTGQSAGLLQTSGVRPQTCIFTQKRLEI